MRFSWIMLGAIAGVLSLLVVVTTFHLPFLESVQRGYRGTGIEQVYYRGDLQRAAALNQVPAPQDPVEPGGTPSSEVYENVQVLGHVDSEEFLRIMAAITEWVSPQAGCAYCHAEGEALSSDSLYTKVVARQMLKMTLAINGNWQDHVQQTGVTCYTCHRGQPVPQYVWSTTPALKGARGNAGNQAGQNSATMPIASTSLPYDPFTPFLLRDDPIRVTGTQALPYGNRASIKQTEWTYSLMNHFATGLGVNCTYCHNTRAFGQWDQSHPIRANAWYGIRMVRDVNNNHIEVLRDVFPAHRKGPMGDPLKVNCATCHQGVFKPLYGVSMVKDYPDLAGPGPAETNAMLAQ